MPGIDDLLADASADGDSSRRERAWEALTEWVRGCVANRMGAAERREADVTEVGDSVVGEFHAAMQRGELRFTTEAELRAYVTRIAASKLADLGRRRLAGRRGGGRAARPIGADSEAGEVDPGESRSVGAAARAEELGDLIERDLGADARRLFVMRAQGASWKDVAAELSISEELARQRGRRIRVTLRDGLGDGFSAFAPRD